MNEGDEDSSSTSESEDEEGEGWNSDVEKDFFKTLASLKTKDPSIYNSDKQFFNRSNDLTKKKKTAKEETMTLRDYERRMLLENGKEEPAAASSSLTYYEEQAIIKKDLKNLVQDSEDEAEDLLTIRPKTSQQKEKEDKEFKEWLKGKKNNVDDEMKAQLKPLKDFWSNPKLDENEKFLKDFILNERYKENDDKEYIPTYEEIVHDSEGDLSEDEKTLEQQSEFEHKFNFRFEEPDAEYIKRYPRTIESSLRKTDDSRRQKREEIKDRKQREKDQKKEDLKQLKKFKLKEIQDKIEQLKNITGNPSLPFQDAELDEDFDPAKHDEKMNEIFNEEYYGVDGGEQKPEFPYDEELDNENWDTYAGQDAVAGTSSNWEEEPHCEDPNFNMDCDYDPNQANVDEMIDMSRSKKSRRKSVFAKRLESKKPIFNPEEHPNYEEYLEEYYKLDYEDIIGDLPVRFKYRQVMANDFGLDTEEILAARDKDLNRWCSVKKTSHYRAENEELQDLHTFKTKRRNLELKKKLMPSLFVENPEDLLVEDQEVARKKRRKNKGKDDVVEQLEQEPQPKRIKLIETENEKKEEEEEEEEGSSAGPSGVLLKTDEKAGPTATEANDQVKKKKKKRKNKNKTVDGDNAADKTEKLEKSNKSEKSDKFKEKAKYDKSKNKSNANTDFRLEMTDERLQVYGFNPKKVRNQIKYGKASQSQS